MNAPLDTPSAPSPAAESLGADAARLQRQLDMLERLAGFGMEIAEAMKERAKAAEATLETDSETGLAFARVSNAVRQTVMLQDRLRRDQGFSARMAETAAAMKAAEAAEDEEALTEEVTGLIGRVVGRIADAAGGPRADRLIREAEERLETTDLYGDVLSRPVSETVALICRDLGLSPDWPALAEQAWAKVEIGSGDVGWPLEAVLEAKDVTSPTQGVAGGGPPGEHPVVEGASGYEDAYLSSA